MKKRILSIFFIVLLAFLPLFSGCEPIFKPVTDYKTLVNKITTEIMPTNVIFKTTYYYTEFGHAKYITYSGSGVIIYQEESSIFDSGYTYYALTNNHVVNKTNVGSHLTNKTITIDDYTGVVIDSENVSLIKSLASYDLALIRFVSEKELSVIEFEDNNVLSRGDDVFAIGQPLSQINAITIGNVISVRETAPDTGDVDSTIKFKVISHNAYINEGSSGDMLLNKSLKLCGINYAGSTGSDSNISYSIPISAVRDFIEDYLEL